MTYEEYTATVKMLAEEVLSNVMDGYYETLDEIVDSCEYIIYNMHHDYVIDHSSNADYGVDCGLIYATDDLDELKQAYAFWALRADVEEKYEELKIKKIEELQSAIDELDMRPSEARISELVEKLDNLEME